VSVGTAPAPAPPAPAPAAPPRPSWLVPAGGLAGLVLWALSLDDVRLGDMGGWGLVTALPALWYAAFALVVVTYAGGLLARRPVGHGAVVPQVALVALLSGTTSLVYDVPRYPWTYKHVGVTEYVLENWSVDRSIDIYHNFPGFFVLTAGISELTGIAPTTLAQWTQPVLALLTAAAVYWVAGGLTSARRVRYGAVLLFTLGDWIGQNYFAPQGLAFPVALFVLGGLLRSVPPGAEGLRWERLRARFPLADDEDLPRPGSFWRSRAGAAVLVLAYAFVAVSHPLSPVVLLGQAVLVALLLRPAHAWLPAVFLAVEAAWLLQALPFLTGTYDLFSFGLRNVAPPQVQLVEPLPGHETALWAAPLLMAAVVLLTAWSAARGLRTPGRAARLVLPLAAAAVPVAMVLGQPYGNEGMFRAYLFALPWLAVVIASRLFRTARPAPVRRVLPLLPVALVAVLTLPAQYAAEVANRVTASDVAAAVWFGENAPAGSVFLPFTSAYPWRATGDYPEHLPIATEAVVGLTEVGGFGLAAQDHADLVDLTQAVCADRPGSGPVYVAVGPAAEADVRLLGSMRLYTYLAYERALAADPRFTEVFRDGQSALFRCRA
jgi:hypothetical protein